jgi:hypothetical protein
MAGERAPFLSGGNHSMHTAAGTATQKPGVSSQEGQSAISSSQEPEAGPPSGGFYSAGATNKDHAGTQVPGQSSQKKSGNSKWAEGGSHAMFGNRGSLPAKGGCSAP